MIATSWDGPAIELKGLCRSFGATRAVDDVSFEVPRGSVFGYIGPNGAGKTTSMRILSTLDLPSMGDAIVDGFSVINDPDKVRKRIGFMPDSQRYFNYHHSEEDVFENVNKRELELGCASIASIIYLLDKYWDVGSNDLPMGTR